MKRYLILILLICTANNLVAQTRDIIYSLKKEYLIQKIEDKIKQSYPDFRAAYFDNIIFNKSNKGIYQVRFSHKIEYIPLDKAYYYSAGYIFSLAPETVDISIHEGSISGEKSTENLKYSEWYKPNAEDKKAIQFVLQSLNKGKNGDLIPVPGDVLKIFERVRHYEVEIINEWAEGFYTINKTTGLVTKKTHKHLMPPPEFEQEEKWEVINW